MVFCPRCGKYLEPTERYCTGCGTPLFQTAQSVPLALPGGPGRPVGRIVIAVAVIAIAVVAAVAVGLSFHFPLGPGPAPSPRNPNTPANTMEFAVWKGKDSYANGAQAFTMLVPKGWAAQGGVQKYQYPFGGADFNFTAKDQAGTSSIFFSLADFPSFLEPQPIDALQNCLSSHFSSIVPCAEDTWWLPPGYIGMKAYFHSYLSAQDYIRAYSSNQLGFVWIMTEHPSMMAIVNTVHPDVKIESISDNSHLQERIVDVTPTSYSGADAIFSYTDSGVQYKELLQLLVTRMTFDISTFHLSFWNTYYWGYSAPAANFNSTGKIYSLSIPTMRVDINWLSSELQRQAQANIMIAQHLQRIMQLQYSLINSLSESNYQNGVNWINTLGGSENAYNPSDPSTVYNVPFFYNYWYDCGAGNLIGTNDANYQTTCASMTIGTPT